VRGQARVQARRTRRLSPGRLRPRDLPADIPPGRCFEAGTSTQTQVALLAPDASGQGQAAALREIAAMASELDDGVPPALLPFRVDTPAARITFDDAWKLRPADAEKRASVGP